MLSIFYTLPNISPNIPGWSVIFNPHFIGEETGT